MFCDVMLGHVEGTHPGPPQLPRRPPPSASGYQNVPPKQTSNMSYECMTGKMNSAASGKEGGAPLNEQADKRKSEQIETKQANK